MEQPELFEDHIYDALDALVANMGGFKRVAHRLWPEKGIEAGAKDLRNCLSPRHRAKLDMFELVTLLSWGQESGCHLAMAQLCKDTGYEVPRPIDREQVVNELQKQFLQAVGTLKGITQELERHGVRLSAV